MVCLWYTRGDLSSQHVAATSCLVCSSLECLTFYQIQSDIHVHTTGVHKSYLHTFSVLASENRCCFYKVKCIFNTVNNEGCSQQSVVWLKCSQPQRFPGGHSLRLAFGSLFYPHPSLPPPFIFPLINQCDMCLVPLVWGLVAGRHGFASHEGITLSRGWLCLKLKPLDIPGTHLHWATQLFNIFYTWIFWSDIAVSYWGWESIKELGSTVI